jgi:hypothetical protein
VEGYLWLAGINIRWARRELIAAEKESVFGCKIHDLLLWN